MKCVREDPPSVSHTKPSVNSPGLANTFVQVTSLWGRRDVLRQVTSSGPGWEQSIDTVREALGATG